jgi:WG repeat protein
MSSVHRICCVVLAVSSIARADDARYSIWEKGGNGFVDGSGKVVIKPQFDTARDFHDGFACVQAGKDWRMIDLAGKRVGPALTDCSDFAGGFVAVTTKAGEVGYLDGSGKLAIVPVWNKQKAVEVESFHDGLAPVRVGAKWGFIDTRGAWIVSPTYGPDIDFAKFQASLKKACEGGDGMPSEECMQLNQKYDFDAARAFSDGLAAVKVGGKWGYIDTKGTLVIKPRFDEISGTSRGVFFEGLAVVDIAQDKYVYIDHAGAVAIPGPFAFGTGFHDGLAAVRDASGWKYIDKTGKVILQLAREFTMAQEFHEGLAVVATKKRGYIDKTGKLVIPAILETSHPFEGGHAEVSILDGNMPVNAVIDRSGTPIWIQENNKAAWQKALAKP